MRGEGGSVQGKETTKGRHSTRALVWVPSLWGRIAYFVLDSRDAFTVETLPTMALRFSK